MTTSVPTVVPIQEIKLRIARMMELAQEAVRLTGDIAHVEMAIGMARALFESEIKLAAHLGRLDWGYVNNLGKSLERVERNTAAARARLDANRSKPAVDIP